MRAKKVSRPSYISKVHQTDKVWTAEEESILTNIVEDAIHGIRWIKVAKKLPGKSVLECQAKWQEILKRDSNAGKWTAEEDELLRKWVV